MEIGALQLGIRGLGFAECWVDLSCPLSFRFFRSLSVSFSFFVLSANLVSLVECRLDVPEVEAVVQKAKMKLQLPLAN